MREAAKLMAVVALLHFALWGCGGGGGSGSGSTPTPGGPTPTAGRPTPTPGGGGNSSGTTWPERGGGMTSEVPAVVQTGRVVFVSESGEACCVALDPQMLGDMGVAVLTNLPPGPATVAVAGFSENFAPTVAGIFFTCETSPIAAARACDLVQAATPAFESAPQPVSIVAGVQTDVGEVALDSFPFVYEFSPGQGTSNQPPIDFAFTVVDAINGIRRDSVALDMIFEIEDETVEPPVFRSMTKRVPIELRECDDLDSPFCSSDGALELVGFKADGTAPRLPAGQVEARITAENLSDPPHPVDFRYPLIVEPTPAPTSTPTTAEALEQAAPGLSAEGADAADASAPVAGGRGLAASVRTPPANASAGAAGSVVGATPTATVTPGERSGDPL